MLDRRHLLFAAGATGAALASHAAGATAVCGIDLGDPRTALNAYVKLRGSTAQETVFQPYEGDIFLAADVPADLVVAAEKVWPGYVLNDSVWTAPTSGRLDYIRAKQGLGLSR